MAQHDYVIANDTAANVRADINTALQAIASNNSGASAPSTTYANQWWYDTSTDTLKIRSEANDAWISVAVLDQTNGRFVPVFTGPIEFADGSAAAPSLTNTGDTNTGFFFPSADVVAIATSGSERFRAGSSGELGVAGANYGTSGQVLTSGGSGAAPAWANIPAPTTAQAGTATAGLAVGDVGSYAFMQNQSGSAIAAGGTVAGSSLRFADVNWSAAGTPSASGTWRVMGRFSASGTGATGALTVCMRIS